MTSNKRSDWSRKRRYTLRARARRHEQVHQRITLAAVELHGSLGPAQTTVSEIAKRAGVQRATVYNHFPTDRDLMDACSSHWFSENPPPDARPWAEIREPVRRCVTALGAMYAYYETGQEMLEKVLLDAARVPALEEILRLKWEPLLDGIAELVADAWESSEAELGASIRVALDFFTWKMLSASGLSNERASQLATAWIATGSRFPLQP